MKKILVYKLSKETQSHYIFDTNLKGVRFVYSKEERKLFNTGNRKTVKEGRYEFGMSVNGEKFLLLTL